MTTTTRARDITTMASIFILTFTVGSVVLPRWLADSPPAPTLARPGRHTLLHKGQTYERIGTVFANGTATITSVETLSDTSRPIPLQDGYGNTLSDGFVDVPRQGSVDAGPVVATRSADGSSFTATCCRWDSTGCIAWREVLTTLNRPCDAEVGVAGNENYEDSMSTLFRTAAESMVPHILVWTGGRMDNGAALTIRQEKDGTVKPGEITRACRDYLRQTRARRP